MLTKISLIALTSLLFAGNAHAAPCTDLKSCAKAVTDITGQTYVWDADGEKAKFFVSAELDINKENAEIVFTSLLDQAGLARMPIGDGKTFRILKGTMIKELNTPIVEASLEYPPTLPKTWDWVTMRYKMKSAEMAPIFEQSYRLHVPREGRMQADINNGTVIVTGAAPMVKHMYEMLKASDKPLTELARKKHREYEARMDAIQAKQKN